MAKLIEQPKHEGDLFMKTTTCPICGKEIRNCNYKKHLLSHEKNPNYHIKKQARQSVDHSGLECKYCGKLCKNKNSLAQHELYCKGNPNRKVYKRWNDGLTKETDQRLLTEKAIEAHKLRGLKHYQAYLADNSLAWGVQNMGCYKKYFLEEQDHKCAICGMTDSWQGRPLVFVLDHIDGNADNNNRDNLRLICPNCDSQLSTFKSKNKHSARAKHRNIKVIKINDNAENNSASNE